MTTSKIQPVEPKSGAVKVFSLIDLGVLVEARKLQFFREQFGRLAQIANNDNLPVQTRISKLKEIADKHSKNFPFEHKEHMKRFNIDGVFLITRQALALADQLQKIESVRIDPASKIGQQGNQI